MIIGVDGNEANVLRKVGVSVYASEMLHYFQKKSSKDLQFLIYVRTKPLPGMPKETPFFTYRLVKGRRLWRDFVFPLYLYTHPEIDVLFCPAHYAPRFCPVPIVVTVHDTSYLYFPQEFLKKDLYKLTHWTKHAVRTAKKVIAVSRTTQKDVTKNYHIKTDKTTVIYNGFDKSEQSKEGMEGRFSMPKNPYLLYVGTIQPRKNIHRLIEAFGSIHARYPKHKLVIVGKRGWLFGDIFEKALEMGLEDHVIFTGYVSDAQLGSLYGKAECFVFPCLYEGFGIPLLEAMYYKCPVVSSNTGSLPEVGGDACLYFDPKDTTEMAARIRNVLEDKTLKKKLVEKGQKRVKLFSWEKSAKETLDIIMRACPVQS